VTRDGSFLGAWKNPLYLAFWDWHDHHVGKGEFALSEPSGASIIGQKDRSNAKIKQFVGFVFFQAVSIWLDDFDCCRESRHTTVLPEHFEKRAASTRRRLPSIRFKHRGEKRTCFSWFNSRVGNNTNSSRVATPRSIAKTENSFWPTKPDGGKPSTQPI